MGMYTSPGLFREDSKASSSPVLTESGMDECGGTFECFPFSHNQSGFDVPLFLPV